MRIQHSAAGFFRRPWWIVFLFLAACNFPVVPVHPRPPAPRRISRRGRHLLAGGAGWKVEILSPQPGTEVPAGVPLTVTARCTGGRRSKQP